MKSIVSKIEKLGLQTETEVLDYDILPLMYTYISQKEILHSKIIADFLKPDSSHNCENFFTLGFLELISVDKSLFNKDSKFEVFTEYSIENKRRIDILITWDDHAIIIENKLNNAADQPDQLKDYYSIQKKDENSISSKSFKVEKVVYMPANMNKSAPLLGLEAEVTGKIKNIYPSDLIKWLSNTPENSKTKVACNNYINLLKHINNSNIVTMNAEKLLNPDSDLSKDELRELIKVSKIINSADWNSIIFNKIKADLTEKDNNIIFNIKENRYAEIHYKNWKFWIELYYYGDRFKLWIADKSKENEINPQISDLGFKHDTMTNKYHYFVNNEMSEIPFPLENQEKLITDILNILKKSV